MGTESDLELQQGQVVKRFLGFLTQELRLPVWQLNLLKLHFHTLNLADYLSRLPSAYPDTIAEITQSFDPFQPDLIDLQKADVDLQRMNHFRMHSQWQPDVPKSKAKYLQNLAIKLFQDVQHVVWIRLDDYKYPRTALYLPENIAKWLFARPIITNMAATGQC